MDDVVWGLLVFLVTLVASFAIAILVLIKLPATYFLDSHPHGWWLDRHPVLRWTALIAKNVVGAVLVVGGIAMLFGPGPGLSAILVGLMLVNFPGKGRLSRKVVGRPRVFGAINRLRAKFGKPPLILFEGGAPPVR